MPYYTEWISPCHAKVCIMWGTQKMHCSEFRSFSLNCTSLYGSTSAHPAACSQVFIIGETLDFLFLRSSEDSKEMGLCYVTEVIIFMI